MGKNIDIFKKREEGMPIKTEKSVVSVKTAKKSVEKELKKEIQEVVIENSKPQKKIRGLPIEVMIEDLPKFDLALVKLSSRDGVLYRKKDVYIAMTKYFFEAIEKNLEKIKIEKY